jgi:hypothetical protein
MFGGRRAYFVTFGMVGMLQGYLALLPGGFKICPVEQLGRSVLIPCTITLGEVVALTDDAEERAAGFLGATLGFIGGALLACIFNPFKGLLEVIGVDDEEVCYLDACECLPLLPRY